MINLAEPLQCLGAVILISFLLWATGIVEIHIRDE